MPLFISFPQDNLSDCKIWQHIQLYHLLNSKVPQLSKILELLKFCTELYYFTSLAANRFTVTHRDHTKERIGTKYLSHTLNRAI